MFRLRRYIKHSRQCFIGYPNTSHFVRNTPLQVTFSTVFSVFGYPDETLSLVFDILLERSNTITLEDLFVCFISYVSKKNPCFKPERFFFFFFELSFSSVLFNIRKEYTPCRLPITIVRFFPFRGGGILFETFSVV